MEDKILEKRIKARSKGRLNFALTKGGLFGLFMFGVTTFFGMKDHSLWEMVFSTRGMLNLFIFLAAGMLWYGTLIWWINGMIIKKIKNMPKK